MTQRLPFLITGLVTTVATCATFTAPATFAGISLNERSHRCPGRDSNPHGLAAREV